jgi:hypothetical protein
VVAVYEATDDLAAASAGRAEWWRWRWWWHDVAVVARQLGGIGRGAWGARVSPRGCAAADACPPHRAATARIGAQR